MNDRSSKCIANQIPYKALTPLFLRMLEDLDIRAFFTFLGKLEELNSSIVMANLADRPSLHQEWPLEKKRPTVEEEGLLGDLNAIRSKIRRLESSDPISQRKLRELKSLVANYRKEPDDEAVRKLNTYLLTFVQRIDIAEQKEGDQRIAVSLECDNGFCYRSLFRRNPPEKKTKLWRTLHSEAVVRPSSRIRWATEISILLGKEEVPAHVRQDSRTFLEEKQKRRIGRIMDWESRAETERIQFLNSELSRATSLLVGKFPLSERILSGNYTSGDADDFYVLCQECEDLLRAMWKERRRPLKNQMNKEEKAEDFESLKKTRSERDEAEAYYSNELHELLTAFHEVMEVALVDGKVRTDFRQELRERVEHVGYYLMHWKEYAPRLLMNEHVEIEDPEVRERIRKAVEAERPE